MIVDFYNRPMQEFGTQTLASGFIQNLIASTPLPICDTARDGDFIVQGNFYIYKFNVIECTRTGFLGVDDAAPLYPSNTLYPSEMLYPTDGRASAKYDTIAPFNFGRDYAKLTYRYTPVNMAYDGTTHYHLGKYLRCLRDIYDMNYIPFYNCYTSQHLPNLEANFSQKNIYVVPIRFNTTYTMSWKSNFAVMLKPVIYTSKPFNFEGYLASAQQQQQLYDLWQSMSQEDVIQGRQYSDYYKFHINTDNAILYHHQKYLYMLVMSDVPLTSLAVVEGNYTNTRNIFIGTSDEADEMNSHSLSDVIPSYHEQADVGKFEVTSQLRLLSNENRDKSYAFSNRLIEGLLHHTINAQDEVAQNIARVQKKMGFDIDGIWDDKIKTTAFRDYLANAQQLTKYDITGNIDKDVEYYYFGNNISAS